MKPGDFTEMNNGTPEMKTVEEGKYWHGAIETNVHRYSLKTIPL